jgi:hypothetical protein
MPTESLYQLVVEGPAAGLLRFREAAFSIARSSRG